MQKDYQQGNDDDIENLYSDKICTMRQTTVYKCGKAFATIIFTNLKAPLKLN